MRTSLTVLALGLLLLATAPLVGCGLKGDLYLPEEEQPATPPQPGPESGTLTENEEEDQEDGSPASPPGA